MSEITIHIYASEQGGYKYDIYSGSPEEVADEGRESIDGGHCTTTMRNALEMAAGQAADAMPLERTEKCAKCGEEKLAGDTCSNCEG